MKWTTQISQEDFGSLLNWFSPNSDEAASEYEKIHAGLVRFFRFRGCGRTKSLADETINRVAKKVDSLDLTKDNKKITIFYGFALNVYREFVRSGSSNEIQLLPDLPIRSLDTNTIPDENEQRFGCLENCLKQLSKDEHDLIIRYFSKERSEKIALRREIASELGISPNALHVRIYRLKDRLKQCIGNCGEEKDA